MAARYLRGSGVVGLFIAALIVLTGGTSWVSADEGATVVRLEAPADSIEPDAHGTIQFWLGSLKFNVSDLPCPGSLPFPPSFKDDISFALYATSSELAEAYRIATFTPACSWNATSGSGVDGSNTYQGMFTAGGDINFEELADVTFEVWVEFDDGIDTPTSTNTPCQTFCRIMSGSPVPGTARQ